MIFALNCDSISPWWTPHSSFGYIKPFFLFVSIVKKFINLLIIQHLSRNSNYFYSKSSASFYVEYYINIIKRFVYFLKCFQVLLCIFMPFKKVDYSYNAKVFYWRPSDFCVITYTLILISPYYTPKEYNYDRTKILEFHTGIQGFWFTYFNEIQNHYLLNLCRV